MKAYAGRVFNQGFKSHFASHTTLRRPLPLTPPPQIESYNYHPAVPRSGSQIVYFDLGI
jgi:hypothetical protein